jgi:hypothetical protein
MKNICVVSYYGPIETIGLAEKALKNDGNNIYDFPLFKYMFDDFDKVHNYVDLFIEFIKVNNINYVLWWYINIRTEDFVMIKNVSGVKYLFFNWDEPYNWTICDIEGKMLYFDAVFVTCKETVNAYREKGVGYAYCLYPGYCPKVNYIINDNVQYLCDISICCTNLYDNDTLYPNQYIKRKMLIDDIYSKQSIYGYKFSIYGPEFLEKLYPLSYEG